MDAGEIDQFEEHYFSCPECAQSVEDCQMLLANGRVLVKRERSGVSGRSVVTMTSVKPRSQSPWLQWGSIAASVVFAGALGYQYGVVYPDLKQELAEARSPRYVQSVSLRGATRSSAAAPKTISQGSRTLVLSFYPDNGYSQVEYELWRPGGSRVLSGTLGKPVIAPSGECQIALLLDSSVPSGEYDAKVIGVAGTNRTTIGERRIAVQ
jgi:hypothetical protein